METMKKGIMVFGAVAVAILMISSMTTVEQVQSEVVMGYIEKVEPLGDLPINGGDDFEELLDELLEQLDVEGFRSFFTSDEFIDFMNRDEVVDVIYSDLFMDIYNMDEIQTFIQSDIFMDFLNTDEVQYFLEHLNPLTPDGDDDQSYDPCFLAGTKVTMADGSYKNIEDIEIDDMVKSYDTATGELVDAQVTKVYHHTPEEMTDYYVVINGGIRVTPNHLLYINEEMIPAGEAQEGDYLTTTDGEGILIESVEQVFEQVPTYDFEVSIDGELTSVSSYLIEEVPASKPAYSNQQSSQQISQVVSSDDQQENNHGAGMGGSLPDEPVSNYATERGTASSSDSGTENVGSGGSDDPEPLSVFGAFAGLLIGLILWIPAIIISPFFAIGMGFYMWFFSLMTPMFPFQRAAIALFAMIVVIGACLFFPLTCMIIGLGGI